MIRRLPARLLPLLALLLALPALASERGQRDRLQLDLSVPVVDPQESYRIELTGLESGFAYVYSVDERGYVSLLFPAVPEDGRGEIQEGERLMIEPVRAGRLPGVETIVAVHTREYRRIGDSRREFLAPDPADIEDVNARLTRQNKELDGWVSAALTVTGPPAEDDAVGVTVTVVHDSWHYDYWCPWCDCWHPTCTPDHCWCGWEVVAHYHHSYHYSHCFNWGPWHSWWSPPLVYVYVRGGSDWDYDTRPWRERGVWQRHRGGSERWRERMAPRAGDRDDWAEIVPRGGERPPSKSLRDLLRETPVDPAEPSSTVWDTRSMEQRHRVPAAASPPPSTSGTAPAGGKVAPAPKGEAAPPAWNGGSRREPAPAKTAPSTRPSPKPQPAPSAGSTAPPSKPAPAPSSTGSTSPKKARAVRKPKAPAPAPAPAPKPQPKPEPDKES